MQPEVFFRISSEPRCLCVWIPLGLQVVASSTTAC